MVSKSIYFIKPENPVIDKRQMELYTILILTGRIGQLILKKIIGINTPAHKNTATSVPIQIPTPSFVILPMSMHSGNPAKPLVAPGDKVKIGQLIAEKDGNVSSPVHASISGTVKSINDYNELTGKKEISIIIESDDENSVFEGLKPPSINNTIEFLNTVADSGVVGLGGAGYPTASKLSLKDDIKLDYMLINGAECEPFITSDTRIMVDEAEFVFKGAVLMKEYLKPKKTLICIENNKQEAIKKLQNLCRNTENIDVFILPSKYPQGERKILVYNVTGRIVPEGARLPDVGCVVINCSTVAVFAKYIETGMPLVSRIVTVDGSAVREPKNVIAPIGTPIKELFNFCGGLKDDVKKILMGGPMMGITVPSLDLPLLKVTNALLAFNDRDSRLPVQTPCIKCGRCIDNCPMRLMPSFIDEAYAKKDAELLNKYNVNLCVECSTCAYVCPAKKPLEHILILSRNMVWEAGLK